MKTITKAIIPVAGLGTRFLPAATAIPKEMLTIVDKPVIQYIVEEAVEAGIKEILFVTRESKVAIKKHFQPDQELIEALKRKNKNEELNLLKKISKLAKIGYINQVEQSGLANAIYYGKKFANGEPVAVLLGDTIITNGGLGQLIKLYESNGMDNVLVKYLEDKKDVTKYGIISPTEKNPKIFNKEIKYFQVKDLVEKPSVEKAPSRYSVACRYVFNPNIFSLIEKTKPGAGGEYQITDTMKFLAEENKLLATILQGNKYDIGGKIDFVKANIDFALMDIGIKKEIKKFLIDKFSL